MDPAAHAQPQATVSYHPHAGASVRATPTYVPSQLMYFSRALCNTPMSFPTLEIFSPPVDLPKWPQSQPSHLEYSAITQSHSHPAHHFGEYARPMGFPDGAVADSHETQSPSGDASWEPFSFVPYDVASLKPPKRKTSGAAKTADAKRSGVSKRKRMKRTKGLFGKYTLADAKATMMVKPLINHQQPVDISSRKTHDPKGNVLKTRHYGVMEIDDSSRGRSAPVATDLPAGLMCVRECGWMDRPCGLFVEISKKRVRDHLWFWHDVFPGEKATCKFDGCVETSPIKHRGRHVTTVHYSTFSTCENCGGELSRSDAVTRHNKRCESIHPAAKSAGGAFKYKRPKTNLFGYIVPTRDMSLS